MPDVIRADPTEIPASSWLYWTRDFNPDDVGSWEPQARQMLASAVARARKTTAFGAGLIEAGSEVARRILEGLILAGRERLGSIAGSLLNGTLKVSGWFARTMQDIAHRSTAGAMALLGRKSLPPEARVSLAAQVTQQRSWLARFRDQIIHNVIPFTSGIQARIKLYADAIWGTAWRAHVNEMMAQGYTEAKRVLDGAARHCRVCPALAALGWVPIQTLVPIGQSPCQTKCRCTVLCRGSGKAFRMDAKGHKTFGPPMRGHLRGQLVGSVS